MAKVVSFAVRDDEVEIWHKFVTISRREAKSTSHLIMEIIKDYVKRHGGGNPVTPLTKWVEDKDFIFFPTLGEKPTIKKLKKMDKSMLKELADNATDYANLANYLMAKQTEHEAHIHLGLRIDTCPYCKNDDY